MEGKYKIDIVANFDLKARPHALSLSQETLLTSTPNVMQFACACSDFRIYLFESGLKDDSDTKVSSVMKQPLRTKFILKYLKFHAAGSRWSYRLCE